MDVTCFCGCRFSCAGDLGTCPGCGAYASLSRVSDAEEKQMRAELHLLLSHGAAPRRTFAGAGLGRPVGAVPPRDSQRWHFGR
jgi:hypothetical protein